MRFERATHDPMAVIVFFEEGLTHLGAVCERTWHDRLQVLGEGPAARVWSDAHEFVDREIRICAADEGGTREAEGEVFPGCPLTFRLAEALLPKQLTVERVSVSAGEVRAPTLDAAERIWRESHPGTVRWKVVRPFTPGWHFTLVVLVRCEVQAIDQHWSVHRLALSWPDGSRDEDLASKLEFLEGTQPSAQVKWPSFDWKPGRAHIETALMAELSGTLAEIRQRQRRYLARELERIDSYFSAYANELKARRRGTGSTTVQAKTSERLKAAAAERECRRADQIQRHEVKVKPLIDALVWVAEPAFHAGLEVLDRSGTSHRVDANFNPRLRRWVNP